MWYANLNEWRCRHYIISRSYTIHVPELINVQDLALTHEFLLFILFKKLVLFKTLHSSPTKCQNWRKLDGQGKARREAARRRNSKCKINLSCWNSSRGNGSRPTVQRWLAGSAALRPMWHAAGQSPLRSKATAIAAGGILTTKIDFALGIVAPGGLTSGFALPI